MHLFAETSTFTFYLYGWHLKVLGIKRWCRPSQSIFSKQGHEILELLNVWKILIVVIINNRININGNRTRIPRSESPNTVGASPMTSTPPQRKHSVQKKLTKTMFHMCTKKWRNFLQFPIIITCIHRTKPVETLRRSHRT